MRKRLKKTYKTLMSPLIVSFDVHISIFLNYYTFVNCLRLGTNRKAITLLQQPCMLYL